MLMLFNIGQISTLLEKKKAKLLISVVCWIRLNVEPDISDWEICIHSL